MHVLSSQFIKVFSIIRSFVAANGDFSQCGGKTVHRRDKKPHGKTPKRPPVQTM